MTVFGARDYAMQVWLEPDKLQSLNLSLGMNFEPGLVEAPKEEAKVE